MAREDRKLSKRQAALAVEISNASLSDIENGINFPSEPVLLRLVEQYGPNDKLRHGIFEIYANAKNAPPPDISAYIKANVELWGLIRDLMCKEINVQGLALLRAQIQNMEDKKNESNDININEYTNFIWKIAELLRGDYKQSEYGYVILPFTVLARLDSVLLSTKDKVLELDKTLNFSNKAPFFERATGMRFYNTSNFTLHKLKDDAPNIAANLRDYIGAFSLNVQEILDAYDIHAQISLLSYSAA
ncbi:transcriptional regulator with XRE-family HTH domain [Paenibacillus sp. PvR053]